MEAEIRYCPIKRHRREFYRFGRGLVRSLRQMRREVRICQQCPQRNDCPVLAEFHAMVDSVIDDLVEEWSRGI